MNKGDQAAGLRQLFGRAARIGWIDCLDPPLDCVALNAQAKLRKLEFVTDLRNEVALYVCVFEANERGVLAAYAQLKSLLADRAAPPRLYAWSHALHSPQQQLIANLVTAVRQFLGVGLAYQGALDFVDPAALATLAERSAVLALCDDASAQRRALEYNP